MKQFVSFAIFVLAYYSGFNFTSAVVFIIKDGSDNDAWFYRMFLSLVCLGFAGVICAIRQSKEEKL